MLAEFIAPSVVTGVAHGQYSKFDDKDAFVTYDTERALGGDRKRITFGKSDPFFNAQPQGLEIAIDDHERKLAGDGGVLKIQQAKLRNLVNTAQRSHEAKVFKLVKSAKAAAGGKGVWSDAAADPIAELDEQIEAIVNDTGMMPNRMVIGLGAWRILKNHPKVIDRLNGVNKESVSLDQLGSMLLNPNVEIRVGVISADINKIGKGKNARNVVGAEVFIFIASDSPDQFDPSFAKTFMPEVGSIESVKEYRDETAASDIYATDWAEDIQVVAPISGRRITLS